MHPRTSPSRSTGSSGSRPGSSNGSSTGRPAYRRSGPPRPRRAAETFPGLDLEGMFATSEAAAAAETDAPTPTWLSLGLPQNLVTALERRDIRAPFAIQTRVMPDALAGRDILGRAQTGSGKTLGFGLPMLTRLAASAPASRGPGATTRRPGTPRALVLVPTRELAGQVSDALSPLGHRLDLRFTVVVGGAPMGRQIDQLRRGTDVVVATPGRLVDLIERGICDLSQIEVTVLDEADYMADLGFLPAVTQLLDMTPKGGQRMLFSATLDDGIKRLVVNYLNDPAAHAVASASSHVATMEHKAFVVRRDEKQEVLERITRRPARTLLFVRTRHGADRLATSLQQAGVDADAIHGDLGQSARQRALDAFSSGRRRVLVATDVAARGIHVDDLDLVIHVDPPADHKDYMHRSGRTARAGADGTVLSLLTPDQVNSAARQRDRAGVTASVDRVDPSHPEVEALATSGDAIVVTAEEPRRSYSDRPARPRYDRGARSGQGARPSGQGERRSYGGPRRSGGDHSAGPRTSTPA